MTTEINPNAQAAPSPAAGNGKRKRALLAVAAVVVIALVAWLLWYVFIGRWHVDTDDAYVQGNVVEIKGDPAVAPAVERSEGFHEAIADSEIKVIAEQHADWDEESAAGEQRQPILPVSQTQGRPECHAGNRNKGKDRGIVRSGKPERGPDTQKHRHEEKEMSVHPFLRKSSPQALAAWWG